MQGTQTRMNVYLKNELHARLKKLALAEKRSCRAQIEYLLESYLKKVKHEEGEPA
jgi:hypothetical protein